MGRPMRVDSASLEVIDSRTQSVQYSVWRPIDCATQQTLVVTPMTALRGCWGPAIPRIVGARLNRSRSRTNCQPARKNELVTTDDPTYNCRKSMIMRLLAALFIVLALERG